MSVKLYLESDEFYPMYYPASNPQARMVEYCIDVDEGFIDRLIKVNAEFSELQAQIAEMVMGGQYLPNLRKPGGDV